MGNTKGIEFCWFAPTAGDKREIGTGEYISAPDVNYVIDVSQKAEENGFDSILVPVCDKCMDPFIVSALILQNTKKIKTITAINPGMASPQVLGTMISTIINKFGNRIDLNLIKGNISTAIKQGLIVKEESELANLLDEFTSCLIELLQSQEPVTFDGSIIKLNSAQVIPHALQAPKIYIGGGPFSLDIAAKNSNTYLMFADSLEKVNAGVRNAQQMSIDKYNRHIDIGIGLNVVARKTHLEAIEACNKLISNVPRNTRLKMKYYYSKNSIMGRTIKEIEQKNYFLEDNIWLGLAKARIGPITTLYGSYEEVSDKIKRYHDVGVTCFSLTSYPLLEEVERIGENIIPKLINLKEDN